MVAIIVTLIICSTVMAWSYRYLQPYEKPVVKEIEQPSTETADLPSFDKIIAEIYGRKVDEDD